MGVLSPLINAFRGGARTPEAKMQSTGRVSQVSKPAGWLVDLVGGGIGNDAGERVGPDNAMRTTAVLRSIALLSETVAMLPLICYKQGEMKEFATNFPAFKVVKRKPNPWQTAYEFWRMMMVHLCLRGNAYAFIMRDEKFQVKHLLPVHPDLVQVYRMDNGEVLYRFRLWTTDVEEYEVRQDQMMHLRWLSQDGYLAMSPIELSAQALGVTLAAEKFGAKFFSQGTKLSGVVTIPGKLDDTAQERALKFWNKFLSGGHNAHKVAVLSDGATFNAISVNPRDAQFLELRQFQIEDIARIYGIPPHMLGSLTKNTTWGSGLEQQLIGFLRFTIQPHLVMIAQACMRDLLIGDEEDEYEFEHDVSALIQGDLNSVAKRVQGLYNGGLITRNEARRPLGLPPDESEEGNKFRVPTNTIQEEDEGEAQDKPEDDAGEVDPPPTEPEAPKA